MSASIFNQGVFHGFAVNTSGQLIERWGNPPVNLNAIADGFLPNTPVSVARIVYDPDNGFYPAYFVSGLARSGSDVIIWLWTGQGWQGPYGG